MSKPFRFKQFSVDQDLNPMKIGTDAVLLGAWTEITTQVDKILDIGAGTGIIALMMAQRSEAFTIDAVELDEKAYLQTVSNFENSPWSDRLYGYHASFEDFAEEFHEEEETYDLIVSNPPYYESDYQTEDVSRNRARFESELTFDNLLKGVALLLDKKGIFSTIIPRESTENFIALANQYQLHMNRICEVRGNAQSKVKRSLLSFSFESKPIEKTSLTIEHNRHEYTEEYITLTQDFYLKM